MAHDQDPCLIFCGVPNGFKLKKTCLDYGLVYNDTQVRQDMVWEWGVKSKTKGGENYGEEENDTQEQIRKETVCSP